jgi:phage repressor protein C with HTH and peptisase S24 domain
MEKIKDDLGARIVEVRTRLEMNQSEFAEKLGVTTGSISHWEKGTRRPSVETIKLIADVGQVEFLWLLTGKEAETIEDLINIPFKKIDEYNQIKWIKRALNKFGLKTFRIVASLSAGDPKEFFDDGQLDEENDVVISYPHKNCLALKVVGNSMIPRINDSDIVIVDLSKNYKNEDIVAVRLKNGEQLIKRINKSDIGDIIVLYSENPEYPPITCRSEEIERIHKVVKVIKDL